VSASSGIINNLLNLLVYIMTSNGNERHNVVLIVGPPLLLSSVIDNGIDPHNQLTPAPIVHYVCH